MGEKKVTTSVELPTARLRPRRRVNLAWLLPIAALAFAGALMYRTWQLKGIEVTIIFDDGHGLREGDEVRFRGIKVGEIESVSLTDAADGTVVVASLSTHARQIARQGTQFWIERPRIAPSGVRGLDTIIGPRYLAVRLGSDADAPPRFRFIGLVEPPILDREGNEGDLEIILQAASRGSLQVGGPVNFREFRVGTVMSVGLASDGSAVEARVHIDQAYAPLIRQRTKFWDSGGVSLDVGLGGISMDVNSLESVVIGSVSFATPPEAGEAVRTGHRFQLAPDVQPEWLTWQPNVPVGSDLLPPGAPLPPVERARLSWKQSIFRTSHSRIGWVLQVDEGLLGPLDLLMEDEDAREGTSRLAIAGREFAHDKSKVAQITEVLGVLQADPVGPMWPHSSMRHPEQAEDCLIVAASSMPPIPLAAARVTERESFWRIDEGVSFDDSWHGAAVLSREDGALVGVLLVGDGIGRVALLPQSWIEP